jgi:hypothetical protein
MKNLKINLKDKFKDAMRTKFNQSVRKKVIDTWIERNELDKERITEFLDRVIVDLFNVTWNPYDCSDPAESQDEKVAMQIEYIKELYGDVIDKYPLEVLYYVGCVNVVDQIFKERIFEQPYQNPYDGKFHTEYERILIQDLGVKRLFKV